MVLPNTSPTGSASRSGLPSCSSIPCSFSICSASSRTPLCPAPETDWYELTISERSPAARWSGATAMSVVMMVQFGTANTLAPVASASGFTSGITSSAQGSMRNALELSMQIVPASAAAGIQVFAIADPHELSAMSTPSSASCVSTPTVRSAPRNGTRVPAVRSEASGISSSTGKLRSSRRRTMFRPTAPVAPTTATRMVRPWYRGNPRSFSPRRTRPGRRARTAGAPPGPPARRRPRGSRRRS